jgi:hypothetical protein
MHLKYNDVDTELPPQLELYIDAAVILWNKNVSKNYEFQMVVKAS